MKRVIFDILLFISIFIFPWWISIPLLFLGLFAFKNFYEFVVAGILTYSLYSPAGGDRLISSPVFLSAVIIIIFIVAQLIKDNIIFYKK